MSEQILERAASSTAPIPGDLGVSGTPEAPKGSRNRTFVVIALAVVAGLVIGGLVLFVLQPGSSGEADAAAAPGPAAAAPAASGAGDAQAADAGTANAGASAAEGGEAAAPKKSTARLTSRDPFAPLIPKKPVAPPEPVKPDAVVPAPVPAAPDIPAPSTPATGGTISALAISPLGNEVTLKLDGKKYTVEEGEAFAKSYRLYDIFNDNCAGFLYGDRNAVVCEGDSVTIG